MIPFVVQIEERSFYSKVIFAKSEEECREKAGKLSTLLSSSKSKELDLDDQKINTVIFRLDDEE
jgi:hypothetical protein